MSFEYTVKYPRALTDAEVARWATEWNDSGIFSGDILLFLFFVLLAAIPWLLVLFGVLPFVNSRARSFIRSRGSSMLAYGVGWFFLFVIVNDIFFAVFFKSPIWASYYNAFGAESASSVENAVAHVRASAILFGIWD